ncbi:ArsR/SmtB family transcription factor [Streptomyces johnsoniae]|uniref:Helix-turn-helix domain-containing protein n=1 Tax=Streptomyces johnsoniae TaxID=3075532 RepID=A0ABU2S4Q5_9ACTN|nr:helix-turn-helix domain-containing protein [Streptomyces sp. DSM 41886]MDT0443935.1 helix-turn-helix domain-containing protein [Streptomyces sp. DSM 41886]
MLRIHLTGEDLARIRIAEGPDPMWETMLSSHRFRDRRAQHIYGPWRLAARRRIRALPGTLRALVPPTGYFPDFLNPLAAQEGWDSAVEALRATPRRRLAADIALLAAGQPSLPHWVRLLADGEREAVEQLVADLERYRRAALDAAVWQRVQADVDADRAVRVRHLLAGGAQGLLAGLRPVLRWNPPVLESDYPVRRELFPGGRGLLLVPSYFCGRQPVTYADKELTPVVVYPVEHAAPPRPSPSALGRLLGGTRARVLGCIEYGTTTGELARRAGVSPASASQHARVLRDAGLVRSVRRGSEVLHTLTPLGADLLT